MFFSSIEIMLTGFVNAALLAVLATK